ncbi:unnamed protein product [Pleuronectes platessa]|uniref:Uncharacterized protein n=1 Tax=Pleuronectes platessa TaxID=8262 RepID=A0A9N7YAG5_PLEPL|nr:unnamed protein product [Pleuronectes platessa]
MADVAGALGVGGGCLARRCLESGFAVGSSEALKPLLSVFPPASPSPPSTPSVGWSGVGGRKREGGGEGKKEEGAKRIQGPGPTYHDQHRAFHGSYCPHPTALFSPFLPGSTFI